tara:strand:- start:841 stop:1437 length:597 start_codon:yes stop_codon:yes gene_type:complete
MGFKNNVIYQIGTLFGLGALPGGGTWASLVVLLPATLLRFELQLNFLMFFLFITLFFAPTIYKNSRPFFKSKDPKEFVLDEILGMCLALLLIYIFLYLAEPISADALFYSSSLDSFGVFANIFFVATFILFRILDISKIGPVGWVEDPTTAPSWWQKLDTNDNPYMRVIGDDIFAGLLSSSIIIAITLIITAFFGTTL